MIKQSFLDSLNGLFLDQAEALIESEGLVTYSLPKDSIVNLIARPGTVMVWLDEHNQVALATAGDGLEVVDDAGAPAYPNLQN